MTLAKRFASYLKKLESIYLNEQAFINGIKNREEEAACYFYDRYALILFKIISCHVRERGLVEDLLEETMVAIWENIGDYEHSEVTLLVWMASKARKMAKAPGAVGVEPEAIPVTDLPLQLSV